MTEIPVQDDAAPVVETEDAAARQLATEEAALARFIGNNPKSVVSIPAGDKVTIACVIRPWGDGSILLMFPQGDKEMVACLNSVLLPERLSAVYHIDRRELEVIWTAYQLADTQVEIDGRQFDFVFEGKTHPCRFGDSSAELMLIASHSAIGGMTDTNHRNLTSFRELSIGGAEKIDKARSFWIGNLDWSEDEVLEMIRNLNFYLTYYDALSPTVLIHTPETATTTPRHRYMHDGVPETIHAKALDDPILHFWNAGGIGDNSRRFLYYYRIIEYASFYYLEQSARTTVRKILASPHASVNVTEVTEKVMAAIGESKLDEYGKFNAVIRDNVDVKLLWREISGNPGAFNAAITFDGGFVLQPLVAVGAREEDFCVKGLENFTKTIRDIRNALSHGRDQKTATVITPTVANLKALRPWVHLIATAAGEVALYKDIA